ncbi:PREDICTED: uncharacterized protein LOC104708325 [Camelina sativa]|uniref:Uncharacterized protein LOC104708325 n=1 Tax=Camelina sativa TaxID=90675 RepID=A0ABM0TA66_CAMSA|nr:PREDICTED: uncharacterized protein LOC104708325 [Camelina sativa]
MTEDEEQLMIGPLDPSSSMVVIRDSPIHDDVVFPPIYHEDLVVDYSIYGVDRYIESPSESSSPSSSSRHSGSSSSSSFSLFPSDSDVLPSEFDRKSPSETEQKSPPSDSDKQPKSPRVPDSDGKQLNREIDVLRDWWELLLVRVYSKLKNLVTWFSVTLRPFYPVLATAIWWWMRVRARRKRVKGGTADHLRDAIKERDERIVQLLHQIAQMNELLIKHHKDIVSRR